MKKSALRFGLLFILLFVFILSFAGCASRGKVEDRQLQFKKAPSPSVKGQFPNWQFPPQEVEGKIYRDAVARKFRVKEDRRTAHGTTGADYVVV